MADHFKLDSMLCSFSCWFRSCVALIHIGQLHSRSGNFLHLCRQFSNLRPFLFIGGRAVGCQKMTERIHGNVDFASPLFLVPIISSTRSALDAALQGAGIEDHGRGPGFVTADQAQQHPQIMHDGFKAACFYPALSSVAALYTTAADHWAACATEHRSAQNSAAR